MSTLKTVTLYTVGFVGTFVVVSIVIALLSESRSLGDVLNFQKAIGPALASAIFGGLIVSFFVGPHGNH